MQWTIRLLFENLSSLNFIGGFMLGELALKHLMKLPSFLYKFVGFFASKIEITNEYGCRVKRHSLHGAKLTPDRLGVKILHPRFVVD